MKSLIFLTLFFSVALGHAKTLRLSRDVFRTVPFSSQYSEEGALIRSVDYASINALIPQLNSLLNLNLQDRGEAHITVITPPEYQSSLAKVFDVKEILSRYKPYIQDLPFEIVCLGSRKSSNGQNRVFFLVVKAPELLALRMDLAREAYSRAHAQGLAPLTFKPKVFWAHITIGYVSGDVFEFSKGPESCIHDVKLVVK